RRRARAIAQVVDEDAPAALALRHLRSEDAGTVGGERFGHGARELFHLFPVVARRKRHDEMQSLAARGLEERLEPDLLEFFVQGARGGHHVAPWHVLAGIEIE